MILLRELVGLIILIFSRKMLRQWGEIVDICPDASQSLVKHQLKVYFNLVGELVVLKQHLVLEIYLHIQ